MAHKELRCETCNTIVAVLENGCLVIESRHRGEQHRSIFSLASLLALAHGDGPGRVSIAVEPIRSNHRGEPLR